MVEELCSFLCDCRWVYEIEPCGDGSVFLAQAMGWINGGPSEAGKPVQMAGAGEEGTLEFSRKQLELNTSSKLHLQP